MTVLVRGDLTKEELKALLQKVRDIEQTDKGHEFTFPAYARSGFGQTHKLKRWLWSRTREYTIIVDAWVPVCPTCGERI